GIRSISFPGLSLVYVQLDDTVKDTRKQFSDINLKLNALNDRLPQGAGPIQFNSDFGDTAALMLTVASPPANDIEIAIRARAIRQAIERARASSRENSKSGASASLVSVIYAFPQSVDANLVRSLFESLLNLAQQEKSIAGCSILQGSGFIGADCRTTKTDDEIQQTANRLIQDRLHRSEVHPDAWEAVLIRDPSETEAKLKVVAGDRYSYRELDDFTDLISRTIQGAPEVAKIERKGVLPE